jgi:hypothetical protein
MAISFSADDPIDDVLAMVEQVYGVRVAVVDDPESGVMPEEHMTGRPREETRSKQDRT